MLYEPLSGVSADEVLAEDPANLLGHFSGGLAHQFNNILQVIYNNVELALLRPDLDGSLQDNLSDIARSAERAARLSRQLLFFSHCRVANLEAHDLNDLIGERLPLLQAMLPTDVELEARLDPGPLVVVVDQDLLELTLLNLVRNGCEAMPMGGAITVETKLMRDEAGRNAGLRVHDTGPGMDPETLRRAMLPFYTTRLARTGLGLYAVHWIVSQHGGRMNLMSEPGQGTCVAIDLPVMGSVLRGAGEAAAAGY